MPVEIRELQIVTVVSANSDTGNDKHPDVTSAAVRDKIIEACVEQVLYILQQKNER